MNRISSDTGRFAKAKFEPAFEAKEFSTSPDLLAQRLHSSLCQNCVTQPG
jgi:hypothetical protein